MVVNSINFLLFFVVVFVVYYLPISRKYPKFQNIWLFLVSYFFYGFADWRMIPLLLGATIVFYGIGLWLKNEMVRGHHKTTSHITTLGVILGICILIYFKYLNFFADSFAQLLNAIGFNVSWTTLNIVLPIGVSFFTFKLISYIIEIHREHIDDCKSFLEFGTYIAFFPTILSGPIDRPNKFIPQLKIRHTFDYSLALDGSRQVLWGMFTKMCIADNFSSCIDNVWQAPANVNSITLIAISLLYPLQMYADFDGYSNMAIGIGKILGFKVTPNFNHPFISKNIAEYWRNWHMSLTNWLTDYVFSPLNIAFRNLQKLGIILAILLNFILIGLWHGANWTFAVFGLYHGLLYIPLILSGTFGKRKKLKANNNGLPKVSDISKMLLTYLMVTFGLIIFKAPSLSEAFNFLRYIISNQSTLDTSVNTYIRPITYLFLAILIIVEWVKRKEEHPLQFTNSYFLKHRVVRWLVYYAIVMAIVLYQGLSNSFIYFQF
jgi:D-alanyl-lipoteichoic acid acyltransferase DltB (MBOAT superfamily)